MRFKRKIAAVLATIMAFGGVANFVSMDLEARHPNVTAAQVVGSLIGHAANHRLVDADVTIDSAAVGTHVHRNVDFVVPGAQLNAQPAGQGSITLQISGAGRWNYGAPGIDGAGNTMAWNAAPSLATAADAWNRPIPTVNMSTDVLGVAGASPTVPTGAGGWGFRLNEPITIPGTAPEIAFAPWLGYFPGGTAPEFPVEVISGTNQDRGFLTVPFGPARFAFWYAVWHNSHRMWLPGTTAVALEQNALDFLDFLDNLGGFGAGTGPWTPLMFLNAVRAEHPTLPPNQDLIVLPTAENTAVILQYVNGVVTPLIVVTIHPEAAPTYGFIDVHHAVQPAPAVNIGAARTAQPTPAGPIVNPAPPAAPGGASYHVIHGADWNTAIVVHTASNIATHIMTGSWVHDTGLDVWNWEWPAAWTAVDAPIPALSHSHGAWNQWLPNVAPRPAHWHFNAAQAVMPVYVGPTSATPMQRAEFNNWALVPIHVEGGNLVVPQVVHWVGAATSWVNPTVTVSTTLPNIPPVNISTVPGGGGTAPTTSWAIPAHFSIGNPDGGTRNATIIHYTGRITQAGLPNEIPFQMQFHPSHGLVTITWNHADIARFGGTAGTILRIPMVVQATGGGAVNVTVTGPNSTNVANGTEFPITGAGQGVTMNVHGGVAAGRETVQLNRVSVTENAVGGFNFGGGGNDLWRAFTLQLPVNYIWDIAGMQAAGSAFRVWGIGRGAWFNGMGIAAGNVGPTTGHASVDFQLGMNLAQAHVEGEAPIPFIFFSFHPDTGQHRMHIIYNGVMPEGGPFGGNTGQINFEGLMVTHRDRTNPIWANDVNITLVNGLGGGFINAHGVANNGLAGAIVGANRPAFSFRNWGLGFRAMDDVAELVSGRTYSATLPFGGMPTATGHFAGGTATVRVSELAPESAWGARDLIFTLTDADGEVLPYAKIAAVRFDSGVYVGAGAGGTAVGFDWQTFHNAVPEVGQTHRALDGFGLFGNPLLNFSADGHSVSVTGLRANAPQQRSIWLEATFFISTDVNFDGDVYVTLSQTGRGVGHFDDPYYVQPTATLQIAEVRRILDIESQATNINIGFQSVPVHNVVITEREVGALRTNRNIILALSEFGIASARTEIGFNDITQAQVGVTGHANAANRTGISVVPTHGQPTIAMNINRASTGTPSVVTLSGLHLYVTHAVPQGTYGVIARGNAILDNDMLVINANRTPTTPQFRRYAFSGLIFEPYVNVVTPGHGAALDINAVMVRFQVGSHVVQVDNITRFMTNEPGMATPVLNLDGRTFMPLRGVSQVLEGGVTWAWTAGPGSPIRVTLVFGERVIEFTTGSQTYTVNGVAHQTDAAGVPQNIDGSVYVPIGFLGLALGVDVTYSGYGLNQVVWFNNPGEGNPMTVGAPLANGEENGNGNNGEEE